MCWCRSCDICARWVCVKVSGVNVLSVVKSAVAGLMVEGQRPGIFVLFCWLASMFVMCVVVS